MLMLMLLVRGRLDWIVFVVVVGVVGVGFGAGDDHTVLYAVVEGGLAGFLSS